MKRIMLYAAIIVISITAIAVQFWREHLVQQESDPSAITSLLARDLGKEVQVSLKTTDTIFLPNVGNRISPGEQLTLDQILLSGQPIPSACVLDTVAGDNDFVHVSLSFSHPMSEADLQQFLKQYGIVAFILVHKYKDNTSLHRIQSGQDPETSIAEFERFLEDSFTQMISYQQGLLSDANTSKEPVMTKARAQLVDELTEQLSSLQTIGLTFDEMQGFARKSAVSRLLSDRDPPLLKCNSTEESAQHNSPSAPSAVSVPTPSPSLTSFTVPDKSTWAPQYGSLIAEQGKYIYSDFLWTDTSGFTKDHPWYEHDIYVIDADFAECKSTWTWPAPVDSNQDGIPDTFIPQKECGSDSITTDFLEYYPDTRYADSYDSYAIGTESANLIVKNRLYYVRFEIVGESSRPFTCTLGFLS